MANKWDIFYLKMARLVSTQSKDPSTQTGAVIVRPDKTLCSVGFNGFPQRMDDHERFYNDREQKYSRIIHCEMNALLLAREPVKGYTLYTYSFISCDRCCVHMIQAGIVRAVFPALPDELEERWGKQSILSKAYYAEAGVEIVEVPREAFSD